MGGIEHLDELKRGDLLEFEATGTSGVPSAVVTNTIFEPPFPPEDVTDDQMPGAITVALKNPETAAVWNLREELNPDTKVLTGEIEVSVKACIDVRHPPRYRWRERGTLEACKVVGERSLDTDTGRSEGGGCR